MNDLSTNSDLSITWEAKSFATAITLYRNARWEFETSPLAETDEEERKEALLCEAFTAAERNLLELDAHDIASVVAKLEVACRDGQLIEPRHARAIIDDLMRIGGLSESAIFDPSIWLQQFEGAGGKIMADDWFCAPMDNRRALNMIHELRPYERDAVVAFHRETLMVA